MRYRMILYLVALGLTAGALVGCGKAREGVPTVEVSGKITLDGQPLEGAEVRFVGEKHVGFAKTEADGSFTLVNGAQVGPNKVSISKIDPSKLPANLRTLPPEELESVAQAQGLTSLPGQIVPAKYSDPVKTTLSLDVPAEGTSGADFALSSK